MDSILSCPVNLTLRGTTCAIMVLAVVCCVAPLATAQPGPGFNPGERLRALDTNADGKLQPEEIPDRFRPFLMRRFEEAGIDTSQPVDIEVFLNASGRGDDSSKSRESGGSRASQSASDDERLVPGFGHPTDLPPIPGFGDDISEGSSSVRSSGVPLEDRYHERVVRYVDGILSRYDRDKDKVLSPQEYRYGRWRDPPPEKSALKGDGQLSHDELCQRVAKYEEFANLSSSSSNSSGSSRSSTSGGGGDRSKYQEYAKSLLRRYDEDKNGVLEEKEWSRMSRYHHGADSNGDKIITREELTDRLASYSRGSSGSSGNSGSSSSNSSSRSTPGESYRVTGDSPAGRVSSDTERLPKGLPDWFTRNDKNADGQISMSEFSVSWSSEKIAEFKKYDANADGIITPAECLSGGPSKPSSSSRYRRR